MPIYQGSNKLTKITYGNNTIGKVYYGNNLVYSSYREVDLGLISIYGSGDYMNNYYCNAHAYLIYDQGQQKLKITGYWRSKGDNTSGNETQFSTNINVGAQSSQVNFECNCFYRRDTPTTTRSWASSAHVATDGVLYLPLGHENEWRTFNQYDYNEAVITLNPA